MEPPQGAFVSTDFWKYFLGLEHLGASVFLMSCTNGNSGTQSRAAASMAMMSQDDRHKARKDIFTQLPHIYDLLCK